MAANRNGFSIIKGLSQTFQQEWAVASGAVGTIATGTPAKVDLIDATTWTGVVIPCVDGDLVLGATGRNFGGLAKTTSTDTASANGVVDLWCPVPGLVYSGKALSSAAADTQSEINALSGKRVVWDLTSSNWTVDSAASDALANCVVIAGGNPRTSELFFLFSPKGTFLDTSTAITS